jgi:hypothetical protein
VPEFFPLLRRLFLVAPRVFLSVLENIDHVSNIVLVGHVAEVTRRTDISSRGGRTHPLRSRITRRCTGSPINQAPGDLFVWPKPINRLHQTEENHMNNDSTQKQCDSCGTAVPTYDGVYLSDELTNRFLCSKCYNESVSEAFGLNFDHLSFHPDTKSRMKVLCAAI